MKAEQITRYDGLDVFVRLNDARASTTVNYEDVPRNLSIGWVLGDDQEWEPEAIEIVADEIVDCSPVLVHCFGRASEVAHDILDSRLIAAGYVGLPTVWSLQIDIPEMVFDLFRTDLPPEEMLDSWGGRLFILDRVPEATTQELRACLSTIDTVIANVLEKS